MNCGCNILNIPTSNRSFVSNRLLMLSCVHHYPCWTSIYWRKYYKPNSKLQFFYNYFYQINKAYKTTHKYYSVLFLISNSLRSIKHEQKIFSIYIKLLNISYGCNILIIYRINLSAQVGTLHPSVSCASERLSRSKLAEWLLKEVTQKKNIFTACELLYL